MKWQRDSNAFGHSYLVGFPLPANPGSTMLESLGFSAWITIEGIKVSELAVRTDRTTNTVSCWIPSEVGKVRAAYMPSL
jgi:hypothetical protein